MDEVLITRAIWDRYWQQANAWRMEHITPEEAERLRSFHWALLLSARIDYESERLLDREKP